MPRVISVERDEALAQIAQARFREDPRVTVLYGDAATLLSDILTDIGSEPVIFWLDAHWFPRQTVDERHQCSLIGELEMIAAWPGYARSVLLIDDVHLFAGAVSSSQAGHRVNEWPPLRKIERVLRRSPSCHVHHVVDDVLAVLPA